MTDVHQDDAELVAQSLAGQRDAFATIVERHQSAICSIAYSATGCLSQSEDLAQETFLAAWRQLRQLREPSKLRGWLCGIARRLACNTIRRGAREPLQASGPIELAEETAAAGPLPLEQAISREEASILWRSIERIPESYREPLILFYREHQSVERVALALELSEEVVRQRLSRGRKLLHEEVLSFVEGALERSSPGRAFTIGVIASIPALTASVSAGTVAGGAAKGGLLTKSAAWLASLTVLLIGAASFLGAYLGMRASLNSTRTARERGYYIALWKEIAIGLGLYLVTLMVFVSYGEFWIKHPLALAVCAIALPLVYGVWIGGVTWRAVIKAREVREEERQLHPALFADEALNPKKREYKSAATLFGVPLIHIRYTPGAVGAKPVFGWIAIGDRAVGIVFAMGGAAFGGIAVGGMSCGVISMGSLSLGLVSMGTISIGLMAMGSMALGLITVAPLSASWIFAMGSLAVSHNMAVGANVLAAHAKDAVALAFAERFHLGAVIFSLLVLIILFTGAPTAWLAWRTRKPKGAKHRSSP